MRTFKSALVAITLTTLLAGCSAGGSAVFEGIKPACEKTQGGAEIDTLKVNLESNKPPTLDGFVPTDKKTGTVSALTKIKHIETKVIKEGSGPEFTGNQQLTFEWALFSSTTGENQGSSNWDGTNSFTQSFTSVSTPDFCNAITGVKEGSVVAFATPVSQAEPDGYIYILEIKKIYLPHANGSEKAPEAGFPQVVSDPKSMQPGIIQPSFSPSKTFKRAVLIEGRGDAVTSTDKVLVHYTGWIWGSSLSQFESTWAVGDPKTMEPASLDMTNVVPGFKKALDGIKVGSRVIAILPPDEAYGTAGNSVIPPNSTLVFVIDVLDISK